MPKIKVEKVISFSTEDPAYPALNILDSDPSKKWKTHSPGEKSANIVLQFEEATQISSIDIGNDHSAYVEVLVTRSSSNDDYKVLLVMSSFMTPIEARQSSNPTKVRMFGYDQLSSPERDEKWDRVKIVCTQPFNRHVQYGLAFINFTSSEVKVEPVKPHIGKFLIRSESPTSLTPGSVFARRNEIVDKKTLSTAIREASISPKIQLQKKVKENSRNRDELLYDDEGDVHAKIDALIAKRDQEKKEREAKEFLAKLERESKIAKLKEEKKKKEGAKKEDEEKKLGENKKLDVKKKTTPIKNGGESSQKRFSTKRKIKKSLPFEELLKGVIFTISGIQNPERGNIRSMALSMGAKYKPDWENGCTHLVCAFANTPKFNQVRGKGKIVTGDWIPDCYTQRKRLPWRRYALDRKDQNKAESEEEIDEKTDSDEFNVGESDEEVAEVNQKKFKKNRVIEDSPNQSPVFEIENDLKENFNIQNERDSNSENNFKNESFKLDAISTNEKNIYDCDTEDEGLTLKTTRLD